MAAGNFDIREIEKRMKGAVTALKGEFGGLRTGRASTTLLAFTGRRLDARTAERIGLVQQVTTTEDLLPTAMAVAEEIAANAPLAVQSIKRTIDGFAFRGLADAMRFEAMSAAIEFVSDDMPAGYAAKAAKQPVVFEGK